MGDGAWVGKGSLGEMGLSKYYHHTAPLSLTGGWAVVDFWLTAKVLPQRFTKYNLMGIYCNILAWDRGKVTYQEKGLKRGEACNLLVLGISCERLGVDEAHDAISLPAIVCMENTPCRSPSKWVISVCCCLKVFQNCFSLNGGKHISSSKDRGFAETHWDCRGGQTQKERKSEGTFWSLISA